MQEVLHEILSLVKKKMKEQGAATREAYKQYVVETIDYFLEKGKLTDEDNLEFIEDQLMDMWDTVEDKMDE